MALCNKYKWDWFELSIVWKLWWKKLASGTGLFDFIKTVLLLEETGSRVILQCYNWLWSCRLLGKVRCGWERHDSGFLLVWAVTVPSSCAFLLLATSEICDYGLSEEDAEPCPGWVEQRPVKNRTFSPDLAEQTSLAGGCPHWGCRTL